MTDQAEPRVVVADNGSHVVATLNRPQARNAIDLALVSRLHELCAALEAAPRPLVITGTDGYFAAGADIRQLRERGPEQALDGINRAVFDRISRLPMPTIAAVDGMALGAELSSRTHSTSGWPAHRPDSATWRSASASSPDRRVLAAAGAGGPAHGDRDDLGRPRAERGRGAAARPGQRRGRPRTPRGMRQRPG